MKKVLGVLVVLGLFIVLLTGCSGQGNKDSDGFDNTNENEAFIDSDFEKLTDAFMEVFLPMDQDGYIYEQTLEKALAYFSGEGDGEEAMNAVAEAIVTIDETINNTVDVYLDEELQAVLEKYDILPEEFELFMNFRVNDLDTYSNDLKLIYTYTQSADISEKSKEEALLLTQIYISMHQCNRAYYFYGNLNYWFAGCDQQNVNYLLDKLSEQLKWINVDEYIWENSREVVEEKCMIYIDIWEEYITLHAEFDSMVENRDDNIDDLFMKLEQLSKQYEDVL